MERKYKIRLILAALLVLGLWVATPFVISNHYPLRADRGTFGDLYGSINALFSGFALIGVVAAIMLQQKEMSLSTTELKNSARALQKQVELSADAARLQVLPELIQTQKMRIQTITNEEMASSDFSDKSLRVKIEQTSNRINLLQRKIVDLEYQLNATNGDVSNIQTSIAILHGELTMHAEAQPELERMLAYQIDLVLIYEKIGNTKLDSAVDW